MRLTKELQMLALRQWYYDMALLVRRRGVCFWVSFPCVIDQLQRSSLSLVATCYE